MAALMFSIMTVDGVNIGNSICRTPRLRTSIGSPSSKTTLESTSDSDSIPTNESFTSIMDSFKKRHPNEPTFIQAVEEMTLSLSSLFNHPTMGRFYQNAFRLMPEPEMAHFLFFKVVLNLSSIASLAIYTNP